MPASVVHRVPLFASDHWVLLAGDAQAVLEPMAPGSTGIARACGMAVRPFQAGCRLLDVHARACRRVVRRHYHRDPGLVPNPGQNPKVMNA
jgi:hypothetical protein